MKEISPLTDLFPFEYQGGGYFRRKGVPKGKSADILHGELAIEFLYEQISKCLDQTENIGEKTNDEP